MATIEQLKKMKISDMDSNMYQKYKNWCISQEFSDFAKFNSRYRLCDFYVSGDQIARCVAFANYREEFYKAYMSQPEKLTVGYNRFAKKDNVVETFRYKEFTIVKKCF